MEIPGDRPLPAIGELGEGHVLLESGDAITGSAVWCWQALLFKDPGDGWVCGLSQVMVTCPPIGFHGPLPVRIAEGASLFDFLLREWSVALGSPPAPSEFLAALDRLRKIDDRLARGFEHAISTQAVSKQAGRARTSSKRKAGASGSTMADLAVIEDRLRDVEEWTRGAKGALVALHAGARQEAAARKKSGGPLGPHERLELSLFGDPGSAMDEDDEQGQGFSASLMDGTSVDIFEIAGIGCSDALHDRVWGNHDWESVLAECDAAFCIKVGEQDDQPMMSDSFYWVSVDDPIELARQLREFIVLKC